MILDIGEDRGQILAPTSEEIGTKMIIQAGRGLREAKYLDKGLSKRGDDRRKWTCDRRSGRLNRSGRATKVNELPKRRSYEVDELPKKRAIDPRSACYERLMKGPRDRRSVREAKWGGDVKLPIFVA